MKKTLVAISALSMLVSVATAQQVGSQNNASVSSSTSVSAGQGGANVNSNANANVASQPDVPSPKHEDRSEQKPNHNRKKDENSGSMNTTNALTAGTMVSAVLAKPIDSRKCKPGDQVVATASEDVKADGRVVVKKGSKLIGHVTEVKAKSEGEANSSLGLMFDRALLKNGEQVQMSSVVQAIGAAQTTPASVDSDMSAMGSGSAASTAGRGRSGLLGGVGSTATAATSAVGSVGGGATGALNSTVGSTAHTGNGVGAALNSASSGVVGMKGLSLATTASNATDGSVITSSGKSVHLDSGTQMMLKVVK